MDKKTEILRLLRNTDTYISGQALCDQFEISRTAIWKYIGQLKEAGYEFEAVKNKGYRISKIPDLITDYEVDSLMEPCMFSGKIHYADTVDSTNTQVKHLGDQNAPQGTAYIADRQTSGKGRRGHEWESPAGTNAAFSFLLRPDFAPSRASMLTLVAGMAVAKAVLRLTDLPVKIKWPNDIVISGKKICGILTEMSAEIERISYVVVGIGININNDAFPDNIKDVATSLKIESGHELHRADVVKEVLQAFAEYYEKFAKTGDMTELIDEYNSMLINAGKKVQILGKDSFVGEAQGIDEEGRLLVKDEKGNIQAVMSGEVSVRGVYGYV